MELGSINVTCNVSHSDEEAEIFVRWIKPDDPEFEQTGEFLVLKEIMTTEAGVYTCQGRTEDLAPIGADMEIIVQCNV